MKDESITLATEEHYGTVFPEEAGACGVPVEEVARSLGYTNEELALAYDVLNQFRWRRVGGQPQKKERERGRSS